MSQSLESASLLKVDCASATLLDEAETQGEARSNSTEERDIGFLSGIDTRTQRSERHRCCSGGRSSSGHVLRNSTL